MKMKKQAMDRAHRLGQTKPVVVYRIISHASIEDKMFRVQVFKQGLCKTALGKENQQRYFNTGDMKTLFSKLDDETGSTLQLLNCDDSSEKVEQQLVNDCGEVSETNAFWSESGLHGFADYSDLFTVFLFYFRTRRTLLLRVNKSTISLFPKKSKSVNSHSHSCINFQVKVIKIISSTQ